MSDKAWNPEVERIRKAMMERFSDKLSMEEIAELAYSVAMECRAPAPADIRDEPTDTEGKLKFWRERSDKLTAMYGELQRTFRVESRAPAPQPVAELIAIRIEGKGRREEFASLPGYQPPEGVTVLSRIPLFAAAPAPQPAALERFEKWWCDVGRHANVVRKSVAKEIWIAATPQVTPESAPELELEQEADGRWLAEFLRFTGVMAYGKSPEEAIWNAAKVLIESEPQVTPTPADVWKNARLRIALDAIVRCSIQGETDECLICEAEADCRHTDDCPVLEAERILNEYPVEGASSDSIYDFKPCMEDHEYYDHPDLLATIERIANHGSVEDYTVAGIRAELRDALHNFKPEQASAKCTCHTFAVHKDCPIHGVHFEFKEGLGDAIAKNPLQPTPGQASPTPDPFSKGYKHREGKPVSDACGDGKHSQCTQDYTKCHCTFRGGHTVPHLYADVGEFASRSQEKRIRTMRGEKKPLDPRAPAECPTCKSKDRYTFLTPYCPDSWHSSPGTTKGNK